MRIFNYMASYIDYSADNIEFNDVLENMYKMS